MSTNLTEIQKNLPVIDEYFDINFTRQINQAFFTEMIDSYFRPVFVGFDEPIERNTPEHPAILASNHSGMAFPWDAMVFGCCMFEKFQYDTSKLFRVITAPMLSQTPAMHSFFLLNGWKRAGGIDATFLNFETAMHLPEGNLLIYPEGVPGIGKGFNRKYQLQRLATSFIRMSLKYKTDIIPFSTINAEYVAPYLYSVPFLNRLINKIGVPFFPVGVLSLFLIFPFAFYLAFPCKMTFVRGQRIRPYEWTDKPYEELNDTDISQIRDKVKDLMQADMDAAVQQYGQKPFAMGEFLRSMWKNLRMFPYNTPLGWAFLFHDFEKQWFEEGGHRGVPVKIKTGWGSIFKFLWRNPITIFYFIPIVGWFVLVWYGKRKWSNSKKWADKKHPN
jgi:1-acyl-sn-glycerol-3-phosphate acyltransferase